MTWGVSNNSEKPEDQKQVNNVSGTVPSVSAVRTPRPGPIGYSSRTAYFAGISKVIGGIVCFIFGLLQCYSLWRLHLLGRIACGYGEFCGLIFIATGAVAINASQRKTPKRIAASLGMAFISVIVSASVWVYMVYFAATKSHYMKKCFRRRYHHSSGRSRNRSSSESSEKRSGSHHRDRDHDPEPTAAPPTGDQWHKLHKRSIFEGGHSSEMLIPIVYLVSTIFIFVMLTAVFCTSVVQAVVCYRAYKSANRYRSEDDDTTYIVPFKTKEKMMADADDLPKVKV